MALLSEKYQPKRLDDFQFNSEHAKRLKRIAHIAYFPHMVFYGPPSSGKRSRMMALLAETFGNEIYNREVKQIKATSKKTVVITYLQSTHHLEIDFKPYATNDRIVISDFIKERCKSRNIVTRNPKIIVIHSTEHISAMAQKMLLSMVEKSKKTARFVFMVNTLSKISMPLRSRCFLVRCRAPKKEEAAEIILDIAKKENIKLTKKRAGEIVKRSSFDSTPNLRNALHILQMSYLDKRYKAYKLKYIEYIDSMIKAIRKKDIMKIREYIFILTAKNINADEIIVYLLNHFLATNKVGDDEDKKYNLVRCAAHYQNMLTQGNKIPFYIEAFVAAAVNIVEGSA